MFILMIIVFGVGWAVEYHFNTVGLSGNAMGIVVGNATTNSGSCGNPTTVGNTCYEPIVAFTANGKTFKFTNDTSQTVLPHPLGTKVQVVYDPSDPQNALVKVTSYLVLEVIAAAVGVLILTAGGLFKFRRKST